MAIMSSIHLNDPTMSVEDFAAKRVEAVEELALYDQLHIGSPNAGVGESRTVILARISGKWVQVLKVWGKSKSQTYSYATKLVYDGRKASEVRRADKIVQSEYKARIRAKAREGKPTYQSTYYPRNKA